MLQSLYIDNIAVIEHAEPVFGKGLNVLTGETGAGKSIIVDAINAVLGERTSREIIRTGCDKATVVAVFSDVSDKANEKFLEYEISDDGGEYIVTRIISLSGKNKCLINGMPVNSATLKEIAKYLVNIHGQHDNQLLLNPDNHIEYIDAYAENFELLRDYEKSYQEFCKIKKLYTKAEKTEATKEADIALLKQKITEIKSCELNPGEAEEIKNKIKLCENSEKITDALSLFASYDNDADPLAILTDSFGKINKLSSVSDEVKNIADKLSTAVFSLQNVYEDGKNLVASVGFNPEELEKLHFRLDNLGRVVRKYGGDETSALSLLHDFEKQLSEIELSDEEKTKLQKQLLSLQTELIEKAEKLTKSRVDAGEKLSREICEVLRFLDMPDIEFKVVNEKCRYYSLGCDKPQFYISANKGQNLMPLYKVASGGELSRIMLAVKSVLSETDGVDTLIFDEIDAGLSGRAAKKIAIQLSKVAKNRQTVCITHLPQIAAMADNHLLIEKKSSDDGTFTSVVPITDDVRIKEIARLMSGSELTDNLFNSAKELLDEKTRMCMKG